MNNNISNKLFPIHYALGLLAVVLPLTSCENEEDSQEAPTGIYKAPEPAAVTTSTNTRPQNVNAPQIQAPSMTESGQHNLTLDAFMPAPNISAPEGFMQNDEEGTAPVQFGEGLPYTLY